MIFYDILDRWGNMILPDILFVSTIVILLWMSIVGLAGAPGDAFDHLYQHRDIYDILGYPGGYQN